jgi:hypothetical protein
MSNRRTSPRWSSAFRLCLSTLKRPKSSLKAELQRTVSALVLLLSGCGYMVGNAYGPEVRTIEVPIFQNDSFRRGIEYQLTEAVHKEIQSRTPFRLSKGPGTDTRLTGRIVDIRKDVLGETQFDDPRELQYSVFVRVTWEDLRTGRLLAEQEVPIDPQSIPLVGQAEFAPEIGQSLATATQEATDRLARQIVNMLETPW